MTIVSNVAYHYKPVANVYDSIIIAAQATKPKYRGKFVVTVTFMYGDADGSGSEEIVFDKTQERELIDFLNFLGRCASAYPGGRGGSDEYDHIEGWDKWVNEETHDEALPWLEWQADPTYDGSTASFRGATVCWYNPEGVKYACNLNQVD